MSDTKAVDPTAVQAYTDYGNALSIAKKYWPNGPAEVIQAAAATVLIHMKELRKAAPHAAAPQAGQQHAPASAKPAPTPAPARAKAMEVPKCPKCGGDMWDNREGKKNPKAPDFKCKDKTCLDEKGYGTSLWVRDLKKNTAYANAHAQAAQIRDDLDSYAEMPEALQGDDGEGLPF